MKKFISIFTIIIIMNITFTQCIEAEDTLYDVYKGSLGIEIRSYTPNWTGEKLETVYEELLNNTYGEEMAYLGTINLYPNNPYGGQEEGLYHGSYQSSQFLNKSKHKMRKNRVIDLFDMKNKESIEEIAKTLSHEYGHHFTLYYLIKGENKTFDSWQDTNYAKIRGLTEDTRVRNDYSNGHQWNITEIAAEDYIQIFGSPTAKKPKYYDDIINRVEKETLDEVLKWNNHIFNVYPQENFNIPLANDVLHLRQYWAQLGGVDIENMNNPPIASTIALTQVKNLGYDKKQFILQWTEGWDEDSSHLAYTVVAFDQKQQQAIPIKTIGQGEDLNAVMGSTKIINGAEIIFYSDTFIDDPKNIRVFTMDEQGNIVSSNVLNIDFNQPVITELQSMESIQEKLENDESEGEIEIYASETEVIEKGWLDRIFDLLFNILGRLNYVIKENEL